MKRKQPHIQVTLSTHDGTEEVQDWLDYTKNNWDLQHHDPCKNIAGNSHINAQPQIYKYKMEYCIKKVSEHKLWTEYRHYLLTYAWLSVCYVFIYVHLHIFAASS